VGVLSFRLRPSLYRFGGCGGRLNLRALAFAQNLNNLAKFILQCFIRVSGAQASESVLRVIRGTIQIFLAIRL
jgi:hypothetical protein